MTDLHCAICGRRFQPDTDHVRVDATHKRINDADEKDVFAFHDHCWRRLSDGWMSPA